MGRFEESLCQAVGQISLNKKMRGGKVIICVKAYHSKDMPKSTRNTDHIEE